MRVHRGLVVLLAGAIMAAGAPIIPFVSVSPAGATGTRTITRASVAPDGTQSNGANSLAIISDSGRYVAFGSVASNLVAGDTNATEDIFVRDLVSGTTERVSVASDGTQGNAQSVFGHGISADGRYVAFTSQASNLVPGDTNETYDVFVRDRVAGATERVNVDSNGTQAGGGSSYGPSISPDGRYVAFVSGASLVAGDTNGREDVFVRDRVLGTTERISVASDGTQADNTSSYTPRMSSDGRYVAFASHASNLVAGDTNFELDTFVRDRVAGTTERVSVASDGTEGDANSIEELAISADGRYVAFVSHASNLTTGDSNAKADVFVHDWVAGTTERVSVASNGAQGNGHSDGSPSISANGRYVSFSSRASNLVAGDTNLVEDVYLRDRMADTTEQISVGPDGIQGNGLSAEPTITTDGLSVAFHSAASNLVTGDTNGTRDVLVASTTPAAPVITSATHPDENTWYAANPPTFSWAVSDGGISGYSRLLDQAAGTLPDNTSEGTATTWTSPTATSDGTWWFHVKARNGAGVWGDADHYQIKVDSTPPAAPTVTASSHPRYLCTSNHTVTMSWLAGSDVTSGVLGYSWVFNSDPAATPDNTVETTDLSSTWTVPVDADGTYWFHVATVDRAGNINTTDQAYGPICIDSTAEPVTLSPTLSPDMVAQSDEIGAEPFTPSQSFPLGSGTASVQLRSGNLTARFEDAAMPNQGLDAVIAHVYNAQRQSSALHNNGLGQGWSLAVGDVDLGAPITAAKATVVDGAGTTSGFFLEYTDGDGTTRRVIRKGPIGARWDSPPGVDLRVREVTSGTPATVVAYEFIRPDGVIYKLEDLKVVRPALNLSTNTWKVTSIGDRSGNTVTFDYDLAAGQVRLATITHSRNGVVATLTWSSSTGRLTRITSLPGVSASEPVSGISRSYERWVNFTYDASGHLDKVNENAQPGSDAPRTTEFGYTNDLLTSVEDGRGNTTRFAHTGSGYSARVTSLIDRRQTPQPTPKPWTFAYGTPDPTTGQQDTVVTSPEGNQVTSRTSGLNPIEPAGTDRRLAGGNLIGVTDAGYGSGPVIAEFAWTENRLTTRLQPRLVATPRLPTDPVWSYRYNDLGLLIEANEPSPNDPTRLDLPAGAGTATVTTRFSYQPVSASSPDAFRHPAGCVDPAADTKIISEEGYCLAVMELAKTTAAAGDGAQRITDFAYNSNGTLASQTQRARTATAPQMPATTGPPPTRTTSAAA